MLEKNGKKAGVFRLRKKYLKFREHMKSKNVFDTERTYS